MSNVIVQADSDDANSTRKRGNGQGTVERRGRRWYGRVTHPVDGTRPWIPLGEGLSRGRALEKLSAFIERGRETGKLAEMIDRLLERPGTKRSRQRKIIGRTVKSLGETWTSGELFEEFGAVNGLRDDVASAQISGWSLAKHVYGVKTRVASGPSFGDLVVADVTTDDVAKIMAGHVGSAQTRLHTYQRLKRIFDLAEFPCRLRPDGSNPVKPYLRPPRDPEKHYNFLLPDEVLALLRCREIPLGRRVLYLLAAYSGLRKGSLYSLRWSSIDFAHGSVSVLKVKGYRRLNAKQGKAAKSEGDESQGSPLYFIADPPCVMTVLKAWHEWCGRPKASERVIRDLELDEKHDEATVLRDDLRLAGVKRSILFDESANVQQMRFHDLRATFCTWARRNGKSDAWIAERSGHRPSGKMIDRYTRQAQTLHDAKLEGFPDVTSAIPELAPATPEATSTSSSTERPLADLDQANDGEAEAGDPAIDDDCGRWGPMKTLRC